MLTKGKDKMTRIYHFIHHVQIHAQDTCLPNDFAERTNADLGVRQTITQSCKVQWQGQGNLHQHLRKWTDPLWPSKTNGTTLGNTMVSQWQNKYFAKKSLTTANCHECIGPLLAMHHGQNDHKLTFATSVPFDFPALSMFKKFCDHLVMWTSSTCPRNGYKQFETE